MLRAVAGILVIHFLSSSCVTILCACDLVFILCATIISVYDGDTITVACNFHWDKYTAYKFNIRLAGIDTPEIKTKNKEEKKIAILAKNYLEKLILNKKILLKNIKYDKYGRILANISLPNEEDISSILLKKKFAVKYDGGTKNVPINWLEYYKWINILILYTIIV